MLCHGSPTEGALIPVYLLFQLLNPLDPSATLQ